jgi:serine-type D-Ala-D-Ala carboxypeptidase (penicillin-binding protein 5/6)
VKVVRKAAWWGYFRCALVVTSAVMLAWVWATPASAHWRRVYSHSRKKAVHRTAALYRAVLLEDADSGKVLYEQDADMEWPPASMAKMMLLLVASEQIKAGRFSFSDPVRISWRSAHTGGSRLGLREGEVYPLGELMKAALVRSANDAAVAVGEKIAGSVEACVRMMNRRAAELGMTHTHYRTVDGLPPRPGHDVDFTDAFDLATVARAVIRETQLLQWSSRETIPFDGGVCLLHNTNHLVGHFQGCDGLKTGFTFKSGFNLTATAKRGGLRLIAVILGAPSNRERFAQAARFLQWGFQHYTSVAVLRRGATLPVYVHVQSGPVIQPVAARDVKVVVPKSDVDAIRLEYRVPASVNGPVASGERLGNVLVRDGNEFLTEVGARSPVAVATASGRPAEANGGYDGAGATSYDQENR